MAAPPRHNARRPAQKTPQQSGETTLRGGLDWRKIRLWLLVIAGMILGFLATSNGGIIPLPLPRFADGLITFVFITVAVVVVVRVIFPRRRQIGATAARGASAARQRAAQFSLADLDDQGGPPPQDLTGYGQPAPWPGDNGREDAAPEAATPRPAASGTPLTRPVAVPRGSTRIPQRPAVTLRRIIGDAPPSPEWAAVIGSVLDMEFIQDTDMLDKMDEATIGLASFFEAWHEKHEELLARRVDPKSIAPIGDFTVAGAECATIMLAAKDKYLADHELPDEFKADGGQFANEADTWHTGEAVTY